MKKQIKIALQSLFAAALVLFGCAALQTDVSAQKVEDKTYNLSYEDEEVIGIGYAYRYANGATAYSYIYVGESGYRISNVKSSSSSLLVKKTEENYNTYSDYNYDYDTDTYKTEKKTGYHDAYISYFAKKAGTYKVSFDVVDTKTNKTVATKTIKVIAKNTVYQDPIRSIKYCGKDVCNLYPYTNKTSGKLKVTMRKGYQLVKIEIGKVNSKGVREYKKVKNGAKIKLATKQTYSYSYTSSYSDYKYGYSYNYLFPETYIRITYKNKKTKEVSETYSSICTMNRK